ncbi:cytochrome b/b6 domain-containing protein [Fulvimarina sp. MAC3]|uniref:cytochrome b/b6 domain-containing protein n=1 Tax=Fulvimarina sp. MAC3 TaxID=3148887 RepID=UPI0031FC60DA
MSATSERGAWRAAYTRYTRGAILLHWTIAILILCNIAGGLLMTSGFLSKAVQFPAVQFHKTIGLLVLALTVARIIWRATNPPPAHAPTMAWYERAASDAVHYAFYALMLAVPLFGWLVVSVSSAEIPTHLFMIDALPWPNLPIRESVSEATRKTLSDIAQFGHKWLALAFLGLLVLHVGGALKHTLIDRVPSFSRMGVGDGLTPQKSRSGAGLFALAGFAAVLAIGLLIGRAETMQASQPTTNEASGSPETSAPDESGANGSAAAGDWAIDQAESTLGFAAEFSGSPLTGTIGDWSADITFSPDALDKARAVITIRTASISVENSFVSPQLQKSDGFASDEYPEASIVLTDFQKSGDGENAYTATGDLTLKGTTEPVTVPFTFEPQGNGRAHVTGSASIDRLAYGIGVKNDPSGSELSKEITVRFDLVASRVGSSS